ncbi:MAG: YigZ family protein [Cyclobacteriaceae bacterium]|nr:YigZ family protein [Cyclobacteriaceae bacterium]
MEEFSYLTLKGRTTGLYKEKGSKFISFAFPIDSEEKAKHQLELIRKEYHDARHHCFAWIIGVDRLIYRASDDGEPNHSAGDPILGQLRSKNLTNVMAVVVRYFGGIKLGVGGLIVAYRSATQDALDKAIVVEKEIIETVTLKYNYSYTSEAMRLVKDFDLSILTQDFQSECVLRAELKLKLKVEFIKKIELLNATGTQMHIEW